MHSIIQNALEGNRASLEKLYIDNRQEVYFIANCLLDNPTLAVNATVWAFKNQWTKDSLETIQTEEEFTYAIIKRVVAYSKRNILKQSPHISSGGHGGTAHTAAYDFCFKMIYRHRVPSFGSWFLLLFPKRRWAAGNAAHKA